MGSVHWKSVSVAVAISVGLVLVVLLVTSGGLSGLFARKE